MKKKFPISALIIIVMVFVLIACIFVRCMHVSGHYAVQQNNTVVAENDSLAFGDTRWISNGLKGRIYLLPKNTSKLPQFDTMQAAGTIYTHTLNVPTRSWSTGFPGVPNRFEWFGIEYKGNFKVKKPGHYKFRIHSDDGAKLFIDNELVVDNDGLHPPSSKTGEADIDAGSHTISVQYYQGPRYHIALQLFARLDKELEEEQVFPGTNFILTTPGFSYIWVYVIIIAVLLVTVLVIYFYMQRRRTVFIR